MDNRLEETSLVGVGTKYQFPQCQLNLQRLPNVYAPALALTSPILHFTPPYCRSAGHGRVHCFDSILVSQFVDAKDVVYTFTILCFGTDVFWYRCALVQSALFLIMNVHCTKKSEVYNILVFW